MIKPVILNGKKYKKIMQNMDARFIQLAIKEAKKSTQPIGCGVVIVQDGEVLIKSSNAQGIMNDATAHAELNAIRQAGKKLKNKNLENCVIYCSCEPCTMCLSAIIFSNIRKLVYKNSMKETFPDNIPVDIDINYFLSKTDGKLEVIKL